MRYAHVIAEVLSKPWAILDSKFDAIASVLARREAGIRWSEEEIRAAVGAPRTVAASTYVVDENGSVFRTVVRVDEDGHRFETSCYQAAVAGGAKGKLTAVIPVYGMLLPRAADFDMSEAGTSIEWLRKQFRLAVANGDVKTILFDIDSPGGSVYQVDEFADEIFAARDQKKIVAQVNSLCASAAYYIASQASEIAITPSGETGSLGVRMMHQDFSKALDEMGVKITHIYFGKYKVEGNPYEPLNDEAHEFLQQRVDEYGDMFVKAVARGREMKASDVQKEFGQGRVYGASEAKKRGMVDRIATLDETLQRLGAASDGQRTPLNGSEQVAKQVSGNAAGEGVSTASAEIATEVQTMDNNTASAVAADKTAQVEATRVDRIMQLAGMHNIPMAKVAEYLKTGASVETVQAAILAGMNPVPVQQKSAEQRQAESRVQFVKDADDKRSDGEVFGRVCRVFAAAQGDRRVAALIAERSLGDRRVASMFEAAVDPQKASEFASGGFLLGDNLSSSVIELLRPKSVVRSLNPTLAPLVDGVLTLPKITGGATASYMGEAKAIKTSKMTGGQVKASAKSLGAVVVLSNKLLRAQSARADSMVRDDAIRAVAQTEDLAFIRNQGTEYSPKGLRYWAPSANVFAANATINLANVTADLTKAITILMEANAPMANCGWIIAPRTWGYLMAVRDGNGNFAFKDEMSRGTLLGFPFRVTTQIPKNLGTGSDESEIYFADFSDVVIADAPQIAIEMSSEAAVDDGSGNLVSLFSTDMSAIRVLVEHDLVVRHAESVVVISTVKWA